MKRLKKLQCELPTSSVLNRQQSTSLRGGGDKRKNRPGLSGRAQLSSVASVSVSNSFGG